MDVAQRQPPRDPHPRPHRRPHPPSYQRRILPRRHPPRPLPPLYLPIPPPPPPPRPPPPPFRPHPREYVPPPRVPLYALYHNLRHLQRPHIRRTPHTIACLRVLPDPPRVQYLRPRRLRALRRSYRRYSLV